jgi:hypothetical protein
VFYFCSLSVHRVFTLCSLSVHCPFTECSLSVYQVFIVHSLSVHSLFTECSLSVHWVFTLCSPSVHSLFTECSLSIHWVFTLCSLSVHSLFNKMFTARSSCIHSSERVVHIWDRFILFFRLPFPYWPWRRIIQYNFDKWCTAGVTGQQRMLTPPRHLILLSLLLGFHATLHSTLYFLFWIVITNC